MFNVKDCSECPFKFMTNELFYFCTLLPDAETELDLSKIYDDCPLKNGQITVGIVGKVNANIGPSVCPYCKEEMEIVEWNPGEFIWKCICSFYTLSKHLDQEVL